MEQIVKRTKLVIVMLTLALIGVSCGSTHKTNGYHVSKLKEEELKAKSDFNLKQAKAIVNENARNRPKNQKNAEKIRQKTNEAIEENSKDQAKTKVVRTSSYKPKVVPSFY